jgi:DICT domain-containing protein
MDPTIIAAITGALVALGTEVAKGAANAAGKNAWEKIKGLLTSNSGEALEKAQAEINKQLEADPETAKKLLALLKSSQSQNVGQLVGSIKADKVVVANHIDTLTM